MNYLNASHFNPTPLRVLDRDIRIFLYLKTSNACQALIKHEMYNYTLILLLSDGNLIFSNLKAVILENVTRGFNGFLPSQVQAGRYELNQGKRLN